MHKLQFVFFSLLFVPALTVADAVKTPQPAAAAQSPAPRYEAREHYRFNLGGPSGQYTDWERMDLPGFDGLSTKIQIDRTYGKPTDKWGSIARINFFGAGTDKDRPILSVIFTADRKTNQVQPSIYRSKDQPREGFDIQFDVGRPMDLTVVRGAEGKLLFTMGGGTFEVPCDFEIKALSVVGSGVDVKFEPFNLLQRVSP